MRDIEPLPGPGTGVPGQTATGSSARPAGDATTVQAAASETASTLRDQAGDVAAELQSQGKDVAASAREQAEALGEQGKAMGAEKAEGIASAVRRVADDLESSSPEVARHVRAAAVSVEGVAGALRDRSLGDLLQDMSRFAQRQPAAFFGAAALAGFALTRFAKSSAPGYGHSTGRVPGGMTGQAPGWSPPSAAGPTSTSSSSVGQPLTMPAATLGGAAAHRPGSAAPGSMPTIGEVAS